MSKTNRSYYIDNLRIFLTSLVVLHHLAITYGAPGLWYYKEEAIEPLSSILLSLFVATNQAFFMGMFFFISAYFVSASFRRKGPVRFLKDRLVRLGIPIAFYALILSPIIIYLTLIYNQGMDISFVQLITTGNWFGFGPLWFVLALLLFNLFFLAYKRVFTSKVAASEASISPPGNPKILVFAIFLGIGSFIVRIWFPVGWTLDPLGFQLGHFVQYIFLFIFGLVAYQNKWLQAITYKQSLRWAYLVLFFMFVLFPSVFYFGGAIEGKTAEFLGGFTWQSFAFSLWEQIIGISIIMALFGIFKEKANAQTPRLSNMSKSAYTVYIFHALILVILGLMLKNTGIHPTLKFLLLAPIVLIVCFGLSNQIRKLPLANKVL